jgi:GH15 family glucan-1,4-alpha-glucosidase
VLLTRFLSPEGVAEVLDFMPIEGGLEKRHDLVRGVRVIRGRMRFEVDCRPAFDYARREHEIEFAKGGVIFRGADIALNLASEVPLEEGPGRSVRARFELKAGESASFVLQQLEEAAGPSEALKRAECQDLLQQTMDYWRRWVAKSAYRGRWRDMVNRSALALKLMVYDPTGALVAAPTMGLPERIGGERNWDYRYTWIRDAAFSLYALLRLGFTEEAGAFMDWLTDRFKDPGSGASGPLQIMYGIDGRSDLTEETLDHLEGYRGSAPVRIGNGTADQRQLDIYGELIDSVYLYNKYGTPIHHEAWNDVCRMVEWVSNNWELVADMVLRNTTRS